MNDQKIWSDEVYKKGLKAEQPLYIHKGKQADDRVASSLTEVWQEL